MEKEWKGRVGFEEKEKSGREMVCRLN